MRNVDKIAFGNRVSARRIKLGLSQTAVAEAADMKQQGIEAIERGRVERPRRLREIAAKLETTEDWLLWEDGPEAVPLTAKENQRAATPENFKSTPRFFDDKDRMPVYASAEGGGGTLIVSTDEVDRIPRPHTLEGIVDAYGIVVTGDSMDPAFEPGDTAWVNPLLPPLRDVDVILYQVRDETGDAIATIKRLLTWTDKQWTLRQYNPRRDFKLDRGLWKICHRVVGKFSRR